MERTYHTNIAKGLNAIMGELEEGQENWFEAAKQYTQAALMAKEEIDRTYYMMKAQQMNELFFLETTIG